MENFILVLQSTDKTRPGCASKSGLPEGGGGGVTGTGADSVTKAYQLVWQRGNMKRTGLILS